jgi:hypothetical protein
VTRAPALPAVIAAGLAGACGTPTPQIKLALADPPTQEQTCPTDCAKIPLPCNAVMSIRIVDTDDPGSRHIDQCKPVPPDVKNDLCSLNMIDLDAVPLPVRDLDVQIAVFPGSAVTTDPVTGTLVCPDVKFTAASGYPVEQALAPALGGHAYYHPGDSIVKVTLGCTDLSGAAGEGCKSPAVGSLSATVDDFDTRVPVTVGSQGVADHLFVSIGEPHGFDGGYVLNPRDAIALHLEDSAIPRWTAATAQKFTKYACVEVLEDTPQTIAALRCTRAVDPLPELAGMRISRDRLQNILKSLQISEFPPEGLTIGMVVDGTANGAADYTVRPSVGSVIYLSQTGAIGGSATSSSGIFVSRDAPFGTMFSASGPSATVPAVGGLVAGKVTLVIVPFASR